MVTPAEFWETRYAGVERVWSGNVNRSLVDVVSGLSPGTALDLGCGEGGDAIWLAGRGWEVTGIDISSTAVERARAAAHEAGIPDDRVRFVAADLAIELASLRGGRSYDLVTASFLQSPVELPRTEVLRGAAALVAPGGHLLIISHADFPPWASDADRRAALVSEHENEGHDHGDPDRGGHDHRFLTPAEEVAALALEPPEWDVRIAETRERDATAPDGSAARLSDTVVLLARSR
jgi:SAM-dependent methyltransferase